MTSKLLSAAAAALMLAVPAFAQAPVTAKLNQFLDRLAEKNKGMGGVTIATDSGVYSHSFGFGQIDGTTGTPLTAATKFRIASITKMYTAVMVFQLVEEGKLKANDTLDKFFPQIPNAGRITIDHLLSHRSGIHDMEPDGAWGHQARTREEIVARIAEGRPDFEPDARHQYSNAGYILLGYIVERVDEKPYAEALKTRIASRIGLTDTYIVENGTADPRRNEALSYQYFGAWREATELDFSVPAGAGAIVASPEMLDRYVGVYVVEGTPARVTITRQGGTLYFQPNGQSGVPIEATAEHKFAIPPAVQFEFDVAKGQLTITRAGMARVFTKKQ